MEIRQNASYRLRALTFPVTQCR